MRLRLLSQNALLRVLLCVTTAMLFPKLLPPIARSAAERRLMARQASHVGDSCTAAKGLETAAAWLSEPLQRIAALSPDAARTLATHVLVTKTAAVSCLPPSDLATICAPLRFLWYARNSYSLTNDWPRTAEYCCTGDFGAGSGHFRWSLTCALAEAHLLGGRIFVYERAKCLPYMHSLESGHGDVIATLDEILDEGMLHRHGPAITEQEYRATCGRLPSATTLDFTGGNQQVLRREDVVLLRRTGPVQGLFSGTGYWYEVCDALHRRDHVPPTRNFSGVWDAVARPAGLMGLAERTVEKYAATLLRAPFVAVHVRRGDKVRDADRWPGLDAETSPPHILQVLQSHGVPTNGTVRLYVASNEPGTDFFQRPPLAGAFASVTTRHDLPELRQIADSHPHQVCLPLPVAASSSHILLTLLVCTPSMLPV